MVKFFLIVGAADNLEREASTAPQPASAYAAVGFSYAAEADASEIASAVVAVPEPCRLYALPIEYPEHLAEHLPESERIFKVSKYMASMFVIP